MAVNFDAVFNIKSAMTEVFDLPGAIVLIFLEVQKHLLLKVCNNFMICSYKYNAFLGRSRNLCFAFCYHVMLETGFSNNMIKQVILLHLHEIVEGLYFHCSLSVCLSVCVSGTSCEQISNRTDTPIFYAVFAKWLLDALAQTLLNLMTLGQRSRSQ